MSSPSAQLYQRKVDEIHLLDEQEMRQLFPSVEIVHERVCRLTRSLNAVQTAELKAL